MARGGFKVDMTWANHKIVKLVIHSSLGGNCRLRLNQPVKGALLTTANSVNKNRFYEVMDLKTPIVKNSTERLTPSLSKTWLYDMPTAAGKTYIIE